MPHRATRWWLCSECHTASMHLPQAGQHSPQLTTRGPWPATPRPWLWTTPTLPCSATARCAWAGLRRLRRRRRRCALVLEPRCARWWVRWGDALAARGGRYCRWVPLGGRAACGGPGGHPAGVGATYPHLTCAGMYAEYRTLAAATALSPAEQPASPPLLPHTVSATVLTPRPAGGAAVLP
jgi:hypothetical protein